MIYTAEKCVEMYHLIVERINMQLNITVDDADCLEVMNRLLVSLYMC